MEKIINVANTVGLHASLASKLVQAAGQYEAEVKLVYADQVVDAKSILGLMSLAIPSGKDIKLIATGKDAEKVIKSFEKILG
jgi:phosphocarrier protein